ncbi:MAG: alpha/beta hydrolase [Candidatus Thorarchaeota archaeon]
MHDVRVVPTEFESEESVIRGDFVMPIGEGPFPGICKFHGLPGGPDQVSGIATDLAKAGFIVLTFDFRGFRRSEGLFSLSGCIEDAKMSVDHLLENHMLLRGWVGVYGASFGAAVAVCAAARDDRISAVCLRAPVYNTEQFASLSAFKEHLEDASNILKDSWHGIQDRSTRAKMLERLRSDSKNFNPWNEIHKISPKPLYITTGDQDESIDLAGVEALFLRAGEPKTFKVVVGGDHILSNSIAKRETTQDVTNWFSRNMHT